MRMTIVAGMMDFATSTTAPVARTGPLVLTDTCVPVAKMSSAMSGRAPVLNSAVVKEPSSRKPGAKVPMMDPMISGISMSPPGTLFIHW